MPDIDGARLLSGLRTLRTFGASGAGVVRPTFSEDDMAARGWLRDQMEVAGLEAEIDGVGNVFGRSPNPGPALVLGSHSDTQPEGGWLDGAMGVMYAIEIARTMLGDPATSRLAIDAVAWSDEEGTYTSCLGSRSFVGEPEPTGRNPLGESVAEALERVGLAGTPPVRLEPDRHVGYLEAHIEQGPHLETAGQRIGVVTSIVGIRGCLVTFVGEQNHAGTTPMSRRRHAGLALFEFGVEVDRRLAAVAGPASVWNLARTTIEPAADSIIPGRAELRIQFRDPSDAALAAMEDVIVETAAELDGARGVQVTASPDHDAIAPTVMDDDLRRHIARVAERRVPDGWVDMPSAAGHDAMVLAAHLPCAMLFIPSIDGISHDFAEDSHDADIVLGCQVLADATEAILRVSS